MALKEEALDKSTPITQLDSQILTDLVFAPILGITDLKKDNRIDFVGGIRGHKELERRCNLDCVAAIALHPCSIDELMNVADADMMAAARQTGRAIESPVIHIALMYDIMLTSFTRNEEARWKECIIMRSMVVVPGPAP